MKLFWEKNHFLEFKNQNNAQVSHHQFKHTYPQTSADTMNYFNVKIFHDDVFTLSPLYNDWLAIYAYVRFFTKETKLFSFISASTFYSIRYEISFLEIIRFKKFFVKHFGHFISA